jgi:outer membrane lipoprotein LolB
MRFWLACLVAMLMAACAEVPERSGEGQSLGPAVKRFVAEGRIALRQGERRDHLRFRWEHTPDSDTLLLMSPLGQGLAELTRDSAGARLVRPQQPVIAADSLRQLAQQVFSLPLPLEAVADWLRGARPELAADVDGWRVAITESSVPPTGNSRLLRVMEAGRGEVEFKLIVDDWELSDE